MRVVICEDNVLLRDGLSRLLTSEGHHIVAALPEASGLMNYIDNEVDLVVLDVRMPPTYTDEGVRAALQLRANHPDVAVLLLSQYVEETYAAELVANHSRGLGYLLKDRVADIDTFLGNLHAVADGGTILDPEVVSQILARSRKTEPLATLTDREREVLQLMAEGKSNAAIARELYVSDSSIEKYVSALFSKLNIHASPDDNRRVLAVLTYLES